MKGVTDMRKQDIPKVFKHYGITLTELKECYTHAVREAKRMWREEYIAEYKSNSLSDLYIPIGCNRKFEYGFMGIKGWQGNTPENWWHLSLDIFIPTGGLVLPVEFDFMEDRLHSASCRFSREVIQKYTLEFPIELKTFEEVVVELAKDLAIHINSF